MSARPRPVLYKQPCVHTYVCVCVCIHACRCAYIHADVRTYMCILACICICNNLFLQSLSVELKACATTFFLLHVATVVNCSRFCCVK